MVEQSRGRCASSTVGTNSINTDTPFILYFLVAVSSGSSAAHLTSVCICSNSLAADYRAASPRRVHPVRSYVLSSPTPLSSLFSHFLCLVSTPEPPRAHLLLDSVGMAQCHVTASEMYRKRRCTDHVTTRLYSPAASPACPILLSRVVLSRAYLIRTFRESMLRTFTQLCSPQRFPFFYLATNGRVVMQALVSSLIY